MRALSSHPCPRRWFLLSKASAARDTVSQCCVFQMCGQNAKLSLKYAYGRPVADQDNKRELAETRELITQACSAMFKDSQNPALTDLERREALRCFDTNGKVAGQVELVYACRVLKWWLTVYQLSPSGSGELVRRVVEPDDVIRSKLARPSFELHVIFTPDVVEAVAEACFGAEPVVAAVEAAASVCFLHRC